MTVGLRTRSIPEPIHIELVEDTEDNKFFNKRRTMIGRVYYSHERDANVYVCSKERDGGFMEKMKSYAIDVDAAEEAAEEWDAEFAYIFVRDENVAYIFDIDAYLDEESENFGHGDQYFPPVSEALVEYNGISMPPSAYPEEIKIGVE